ncbi:MAG: hypothetical protein AAF847_08710 [Bacteroidota bacterium]
MKKAYNFSILQHCLLVIGLAILQLTAFAGDDLSKTITREFNIAANGTTELSNKYGKMDINVWDRNQVKITVTVKVSANNERKAQDALDGIDVDFSNSSDYVSAETEFDFKGWNNNNVNYKVAYEVYMPATNQLKASMKYGNLRLGKLQGRGEIEVKYGNFYIESLGDNSSIELAYSNSDCTILAAQNLECDVSYSRMHIYEAKDIELDSKYCQGMEIESCRNLEIDSGYDRYTIGKANRLELDTEYSNFTLVEVEDATIEADYTNVKIEQLKNSLDIELSYNNCVIEKVMKGFSLVKVDGSHANFKLGVEAGSSYRLQAEGKYSNVRFDDEGMTIRRDIQKSNAFEIEGAKGAANARSRIVAELSYGGLKIWEE